MLTYDLPISYKLLSAGLGSGYDRVLFLSPAEDPAQLPTARTEYDGRLIIDLDTALADQSTQSHTHDHPQTAGRFASRVVTIEHTEETWRLLDRLLPSPGSQSPLYQKELGPLYDLLADLLLKPPPIFYLVPEPLARQRRLHLPACLTCCCPRPSGHAASHRLPTSGNSRSILVSSEFGPGNVISSGNFGHVYSADIEDERSAEDAASAGTSAQSPFAARRPADHSLAIKRQSCNIDDLTSTYDLSEAIREYIALKALKEFCAQSGRALPVPKVQSMAHEREKSHINTYIYMEKLSGSALKKIEVGRYTNIDVNRIMLAVAYHFDTMHQAGILFGDGHPGNIVVDEDLLFQDSLTFEMLLKAVRLVDLGKCIFTHKITGEEVSDPMRQFQTGARAVVSPEQTANFIGLIHQRPPTCEIGPEIDIFGLGILYHWLMTSGEKPHPWTNIAIAVRDLDDIPKVNPNSDYYAPYKLDDSSVATINAMTAMAPRDRPSLAELIPTFAEHANVIDAPQLAPATARSSASEVEIEPAIAATSAGSAIPTDTYDYPGLHIFYV